MTKAIILGCGDHGRVVLDTLRRRGDVEVVGFIDDAYTGPGHEVCGVAVLGDSRIVGALVSDAVTGYVVAIGDNRIRAAKFGELAAAGLRPVNAVHPGAIIADDVTIKDGLQAMAGVIINTGACIGSNVILNTGCTVDHDCLLSDHVFVAPGAHLGGRVTLGEGSFLGIGVSVLPGITIGERTVVGAGAVVARDLPVGVVAVGVPARVVREMGD